MFSTEFPLLLLQLELDVAKPKRIIKQLIIILLLLHSKWKKHINILDCNCSKYCKDVSGSVCLCPRAHWFILWICRLQKDLPVLEETNIDELRQKECLQRIQTYRLVRENMLEQQKQQRVNRKEMMAHQLDNYEKMQVSVDKELLMWAWHRVRSICRLLPPLRTNIRF